MYTFALFFRTCQSRGTSDFSMPSTHHHNLDPIHACVAVMCLVVPYLCHVWRVSRLHVSQVVSASNVFRTNLYHLELAISVPYMTFFSFSVQYCTSICVWNVHLITACICILLGHITRPHLKQSLRHVWMCLCEPRHHMSYNRQRSVERASRVTPIIRTGRVEVQIATTLRLIGRIEADDFACGTHNSVGIPMTAVAAAESQHQRQPVCCCSVRPKPVTFPVTQTLGVGRMRFQWLQHCVDVGLPYDLRFRMCQSREASACAAWCKSWHYRVRRMYLLSLETHW